MALKWKYYNDVKKVMQLLENHDSIVFYDLETSGMNKKNDRILQFSAVKYRLPSWEKQEEVDIYIKSPFKVNGTKASEVNHITDEILEEKGIDDASAFEIISSIMTPEALIAGYNNQSFDDKFMETLYHDHGKTFSFTGNIDVLRFVKMIVDPDQVTVDVNGKKKPSYKLEIVAKHYDPEIDATFHSSIDDVKATAFSFTMAAAEAKIMMEQSDAEEEKRKDIPRQDAKVLHIGTFNPSQHIKRVYVKTSQGTVFYDDLKKVWRAKTGSVDSINMDGIVSQVFERFGITEENDLFSTVAKKEKRDRALALLDLKNKDFTDTELEASYRALLAYCDTLDDAEKEKNLKAANSAYRLLKKDIKDDTSVD